MNTEAHIQLHHDEFRAMGTRIRLELEAMHGHALIGFIAVRSLFESVERVFSRFRPESELCLLNQQAGDWVTVSPLMWQMLDQSLGLARQTGGIFDPTLLPALEAAGYTRDFKQIGHDHPTSTLQAAPVGGHWQDIQIEAETRRVRLPHEVKIDLGGIVKGWTAEQAVGILRQYGPCMVDAGGDVSVGEAPSGRPGWMIGVAVSPMAQQPPDNRVILWLMQGSAATSGIEGRSWQHGGKAMHHLINPRTGQPADTDLISATVLAASAAQAEAWATAALVMGQQAALETFAERGIAAALVDQNRQMSLTEPLQPYIAWQFAERKHN
jgi:thiamine biosynthesis lipoprotein